MRLFTLAIALAALVSAPLHAATSGDVGEIKSMQDFANCVKEQLDLTSRFLSTVPGSGKANKLRKEFSGLPCPDRPRGKPEESWVLRGALYESLYEAEYAGTPSSSFEGVGWVDYSFTEATFDPRAPDARGMAAAHIGKQMLEFVDCVVRMQPADAHLVLQTPVASSAETSAVRALMPSMSACLVEGSQMTPRIELIRANVAETLYKLSQAKAGVPGILKADQ